MLSSQHSALKKSVDLQSTRFAELLTYIEANLSEDLSVDKLCIKVHLSKFHFHRVFLLRVGLNLHQYIKQMRLKKAAYLLAYRQHLSITDIAFEVGFASLESFSRAFKSASEMSPSQFRAQGNWQVLEKMSKSIGFQCNSPSKQEVNMQVSWEIEYGSFAALDIALIVHKGPQTYIGKAVQKLIAWRKMNNCPPSQSRTFNLLYNDPELVTPNDFRYGIACEISRHTVVEDAHLASSSIPTMQVAKIRYVGSDHGLNSPIRFLYAQVIQQLAQQGQQLSVDFPLFLERISFYPEVPESQAITDIYLPLNLHE